MSDTLDQLRREWTTPCPTLDAVRQRYFPHIGTDRHLLREIKAGRIPLKLTKLHSSVRATQVVYLHDLAAFLDAQAPKQAA
ncbi:pyocin activator PrtN family protein [Pseudomonas sp. PCH446]